jgi:hypothetical protein
MVAAVKAAILERRAFGEWKEASAVLVLAARALAEGSVEKDFADFDYYPYTFIVT